MLEAFSEHRLARQVDAALAGLSRQSFEVRLFAGGRRTYRAAVEPYEVGEAREALIFLTDQSEAVAYQELRSQFVANVSHELRTPLTGLRGLLEALDDPQMDPETRRDFVPGGERDPAPGGADHGHPLPVRARDDAGPALVRRAATWPRRPPPRSPTCRTWPRSTGCAWSWTPTGPAWTPLTDRMAATVVRNLVENAVKYAGPGATAATTVGREGEAVTLTVADDGAGIPGAPPARTSSSASIGPTRRARSGSAGPASGCRSSSTSRNGFGGRAEASSREGFGTTVTVTLPRRGRA